MESKMRSTARTRKYESIIPPFSYFLFFSLLFLSLPKTTAQETVYSYPPQSTLEEVRAIIDAAPTSHPRILATEADFDRLRTSLDADPLRKALAEAIIKEADLLEGVSPIKRVLQGKRLLDKSRTCVKRTTVLSLAYQLTGEVKYATRCQEEMLAAARFSDWNPSHFLDVGEMTFALAIGYDWCFDALDDSAKAEIRAAILEKGVKLPFETNHKGWVRSSNNWGQVCHGGLTAGALAVMEDEPELAAMTVHNALQNVTRSIRVYEPNGAYPEGPGYWAYGTSYNVLLVASMESVLGTDFGLTLAPGFDKTGAYPALTCGPSGLFFNYADGGSGRSPQAALYWFASRYDRPDWLIGERDLLREYIAEVQEDDAPSSGDRLIAFTLLWMEDGEDPTAEDVRLPLAWNGGGDVPVAILRSSWTDPNATFVGVKAGSPSANHGHMDVGSFVLDAYGVRWAVDLGAESYHGIESRGMNLWDRSQDSDRWTIFRQSNMGHNTLVIDGQLQRAAGRGEIIEFDGGSPAEATVDMTSAYGEQASSIKRTVGVDQLGQVLIMDSLKGLTPGQAVRWGMVTPGELDDKSLLGTEAILLRQDDAALALRISARVNETSGWMIVDTETPRNEWDSPNRGTRMVAFEVIANDEGIVKIAVLATPLLWESSE
jgi:hypothetical protein